jgi:hypothetical protein
MYLVWPDLWQLVLFVISLVVAWRLAHLIAKHYVYYLWADHRQSAKSQHKWRSAFGRLPGSTASIVPARADISERERKRFDKTVKALVSYPRRSVVMFLLVLALSLAGTVVVQWFASETHAVGICFSLLVPCLVVAAISQGGKYDSLRSTWRAIEVWFNSPLDTAFSEQTPWSVEGPCGRTANRRDYFTCTASLGELYPPACDVSSNNGPITRQKGCSSTRVQQQ